MIRIDNDILDIQKLESHSISYIFSVHDICSVVKSAIKVNTTYAHKVDVILLMEECHNNLNVNIDKQRIIQALTNLITNAVKFTQSNGQVTIFITIKNKLVEISIKDNGPGIPKNFQSQLFKKFSQSSQSNYHGIKSTGLGLAIVKHIVESHHGQVHFTTRIDVGTIFTLSLPIHI